jgi:ATP-dependent protease HslVU (ClpYQ) peptidase subunit
MTTIVAVKKGKRICLASDSLSVFGHEKETPGRQVDSNPKWIHAGKNTIGISGHHSWKLLLSAYFSKKKIPVWETPEEVFEAVVKLHHHLKEHCFFTPPNLRYLPVESSEFQLLVVNPHGIFEVEHSRTVRQHLYFTAIGTGEEYALGAISAIYEHIGDPEEIARIGIETAAEFDSKTCLPLHTKVFI